MSLGKNYKIFKLVTGEMIITEIAETTDEGMYLLSYPAVIVPIPQEQGGQPNQIGFGKMMPFSNYDKDIILNPESVTIDSDPEPKMSEAYEGWCAQMRAMQSGIVVPNMKAPNIPGSGKAADFRKLNI